MTATERSPAIKISVNSYPLGTRVKRADYVAERTKSLLQHCDLKTFRAVAYNALIAYNTLIAPGAWRWEKPIQPPQKIFSIAG